MKKRVLLLLCVALLISALSVTAYAAGTPDYDRLGSISITMTYRDTVVSGGTLTLYRVADVHVDGGNHSFAYTEEFAGCEIPLEDLSKSDLPAALAKIVKDDSLKGVTKTIDKNGKVSFADLELGLYLLVQLKAAPGYKTVSPFLVSVPGKDSDGSYIYDVDGSPKLSLEPAPTKPSTPTETTKPPTIPQTGQNKWQVPVLAIGGLFLLGLGMTLCCSGKKKSYEK